MVIKKFKLIFFLIFSLIFLFRCGNPPPPPFFAGNKDDSLAVKEMLTATTGEVAKILSPFPFKDSLLPLEFFPRRYLDTPLVKLRFLEKYFPKAFGRFPTTVRDTYNIIFIKDTTCHVYLIREYEGDLRIRIDSITPWDPDTQKYEVYFVHKDTVIEKKFKAVSWQVAFFEPTKKDTEPREWRLKKISGCQIISAPDPEKAPLFYNRAGTAHFGVILKTNVQTCTVLSLAYARDSIRFGDRRLFYVEPGSYPKKDSLLYIRGDSLEVTTDYWLNPDDSVNTFIYQKGKRFLMPQKVVLEDTGFVRIYVEGLTYEALAIQGKEMRSIIWGIATRVRK